MGELGDLLVGLAAVSTAVAMFFRWLHTTTKGWLKNENSRRSLAMLLESNKVQETYAKLLGVGLDRTDAFMRRVGRLSDQDDPYAIRNFYRAWYPIATGYPLVLLLLGYTFGGPLEIGASELNHDIDWWQRLIAAVAIAACLMLVSLLSKGIDAVWFSRAPTSLPISIGIESIIVFGINILTILVFTVSVGILSGAVVVVSNTVIGGEIIIAVIIACIISHAQVNAMFTAAVVVMAGVFTQYVDAAVLLSSVLFAVLLPFLNVSFDWASWKISRWCLNRLLNNVSSPSGSSGSAFIDDSKWWIIDGVVAVSLLMALVVIFPVSMALLNTFGTAIFGDAFLPLDWRSYLEITRMFPLTAGLAATGMAVTTLLPTVAHLLLGGIAILRTDWIEELLGRTKLVSNLRRHNSAYDDNPMKADFEAAQVLMIMLLPTASIGVGFVVLYFAFPQIWDPITWFGTFLADWAQWSGEWADSWFGNVYPDRSKP